MRICVSLCPAKELVRAMCISFPHRHAGNSVQPGTNNRPKSDMRYLTSTENCGRAYQAGRRLTDCSTAELRDRQGIFAIKSPELPGPVIPVLARSLGPPSITNNLDCDQGIRRRRQTAAVAQR
jgi:hypothetical protein